MEYRDRAARRRAINIPGHAHELTFTCYQRFPFLAADRTRRWLAEAIERARHIHDFVIWAFVFMPEHAHVIIRPNGASHSLSAILKAIKQPVGQRAVAHLEAHAPQWIPMITRFRGGRTERLFWQSGGGFDRNTVEPRTLMRMVEYVHLNPVRRGLVTRATDWTWSSAGGYDGRPTLDLRPDCIPMEWTAVDI
jgi:putative transposase